MNNWIEMSRILFYFILIFLPFQGGLNEWMNG